MYGAIQVLRNAMGGGWVYDPALRSVTMRWEIFTEVLHLIDLPLYKTGQLVFRMPPSMSYSPVETVYCQLSQRNATFVLHACHPFAAIGHLNSLVKNP